MKNKIIYYSLLIVLLMFITGCNTNKKENIQEGNVKVKENLTPEETSFLLNRIEYLKYLDYYDKSLKTIDLTNQEVLQVLNNNYDNLNGISFNELYNLSISYLDYYLNPENILCDTHSKYFSLSDYIYKYDNNTKNYYLNTNHSGHKEVGVKTNVVNTIKDSYKIDNTYVVVVNKVFSELIGSESSNMNKYYRSYNEAIKRTNSLIETTDINNHLAEIKENLNTYTYKFQKNNNDYALKEYIINE